MMIMMFTGGGREKEPERRAAQRCQAFVATGISPCRDGAIGVWGSPTPVSTATKAS